VRIVLASQSPRRTALLDLVGIPHEVVPSRLEETAVQGEVPPDRVLRLAREKGDHVSSGIGEPALVIAADTLVVLENRILEKPADRKEAAEMLRSLSGRTHTVLTGVYLARPSGATAEDISESRVRFHRLTEEEIGWYIATGEPMDKAGAYAAQGRGAVFLRAIEGSFHNVVGFPLNLFYRMLPRIGLQMQDLVASPPS